VRHVRWTRISPCAVVFALAAAAWAEAPDPSAEQAMVILKQNCQSCHNQEKHKGGLDLTSRERALKGGEDGAVIEPAKSDRSRLIKALDADADPHMPPKGQLTAEEIATLRRWIDLGTPWPEQVAVKEPATRPVVLRAVSEQYQPVLAMAVAPDGKRVAVGRGNRVLVFDVAAKEAAVVGEFSTPNEPVYSLAWSPDGNAIAVGGYRNVRLWDLKSAGAVRTFDGLKGRITALVFTPDGRGLLAADGEPAAEGVIRQWALADAAPPSSWAAHRDSIFSIKVSADGLRLFTAGADKLVKVWDRASQKEVATLEGHAGAVMALAVNADATRLASAGADKEIRVWDLKTRELLVTLTSSPAGVTDLCWVDAKHILSSSEDGVVRLTNQENKEHAERAFAGAGDVVYCLALAPDGKIIFAGCHDGKVYGWNVASGKLERTLAPAEQPPAAAAAAK
jgi:mono/diheme cytochrome c family protein